MELIKTSITNLVYGDDIINLYFKLNFSPYIIIVKMILL